MAYTFEVWQVWTLIGVVLGVFALLIILLILIKPNRKKKKVKEIVLSKKLSSIKSSKSTFTPDNPTSKPSSYFERTKGLLRRYLDRRKRKKHPRRNFLIRMELNNGKWDEFQILEDKERNGFVYQKGRYIIDLNAAYFVISSQMTALDYHIQCPLPIERTIPIQQIKESLEATKITEVESAIDPQLMERFIKAEIIQGILKGASLGALFKLLIVIVIIVALMVGIDLGIDVFDSGILESLGGD